MSFNKVTVLVLVSWCLAGTRRNKPPRPAAWRNIGPQQPGHFFDGLSWRCSSAARQITQTQL